MPEIASQFFVMGVVAGIIGIIFHLNDMNMNDIASSFKNGAKDLIGAALVVAMAQGIMQVLGGSDPTTPTVINTIMYGISQALSGISGAAAAVLMYLFQSVFNFFVVSGSGQAAITMPIMAPLADTVGLSREIVINAYNWGQGWMSFITPTGLILVTLEMAGTTFDKWLKYILPLMGIMGIFSVVMLIINTML